MKLAKPYSRSPLKALRTAALVLSAFSLGTTGCNTTTPTEQVEEQVSATFSIKRQDVDTALAAPSRGGVSALNAPAFSYSDVTRIVIDVSEKVEGGDDKILYINFDLLMSADEWTGTVPFLPRSKPLTFFARAYNRDNKLLFSGSTDQTLSINYEKVIVSLAPISDGESITLPRVKKISIPSAFGSDQSGNVSFAVEAKTGETLSYTLTPATGGGTFYPINGSITLLNTAGTFVSQYVPPTVEVETDFEHVVKVTNSTGHSITTTFKTKVKPKEKTDGVNNTTLNVLFNPVINSLIAGRMQDTQNVLFQADVADDGLAESLTYAWSFTADGTFEPAPAFTGDTNPTTLQNYTTALQGTLKLEVTDANGGKTTLFYPLTPDQFPDNPVATGPLTGINTLRAGNAHTCALLNDGTMRCWGEAGSGQLGYTNTFDIGNDELPYTAGEVALVGKGTKLAVGGDHTCALLDSGYVRCWGRNDYGQLGYNTTENVGDGEAVASYGYVNLGGIAVKIAAGQDHTCALMDTGNVRCWGLNANGQLGYGNKDNVGDNEQPWKAGDVDVGGTVRDIVAGGAHTCALMDTGNVRCWGLNANGQLGYGNTTQIGDTEMPSSAGDVNVGGTVLQLTVGNAHTCALLDTGYVRCWGYNRYGQLGYGNYTYYGNYDIGDNETPASKGDVSTGGKVLQVAAGNSHTCALLSTGNIQCWGFNDNGQLGLGYKDPVYAPSTIVGLDDVTAYQVATGAHHTCALLSTGAARCWGANGSGQVGIGINTGDYFNLGDNEQVASVSDVQLLPPPDAQ